MSKGISVNSMRYIMIRKSLSKMYISLPNHNSDDIVMSCAKSKFSLTPFCKGRGSKQKEQRNGLGVRGSFQQSGGICAPQTHFAYGCRDKQSDGGFH
jgi:hypothetical protein